jgi:hypothetical protein
MQQNPLRDIKLIGLSGKLGSGKTSLAIYLQTLDPRLERHSFAEKLRDVLETLTGLEPARTRSSAQKNSVPDGWDKSVGTLLQDIGESMRQGVHPDAWLLALAAEWRRAMEERGASLVWVIDDVRHVNEAAWIKRQGGVLIRLEGDPSGVRAQSNRDLGHISETALDEYGEFDAVLNTEKYKGRWPELYAEMIYQLRERIEKT